MDMFARSAPPPGSAQAGDLYVDLQSRTLWLGVDPGVDPSQFVLISDIMALEAEIDGALAEANAYTDTRILTRAPTVHTHTSSQITDFTSAVTAIATGIPALSFTRGMVINYFGSLADIGVGPLAGWHLCDGAAGTPDLRERFVLSAGTRAIGSQNAATTFNTASGGGHDHTVNATAISIAQMPSHDHTPGTGGESTDHQHYVSGTSDAQGNHAHNVSFGGAFGSNAATRTNDPRWSWGDIGTGVTNANTAAAGNHAHNVNFWSGGRNAGHTHAIYAQGGNQGHSHTLVGGGGAHVHTITDQQLRETLPFFALAYIMKL